MRHITRSPMRRDRCCGQARIHKQIVLTKGKYWLGVYWKGNAVSSLPSMGRHYRFNRGYCVRIQSARYRGLIGTVDRVVFPKTVYPTSTPLVTTWRWKTNEWLRCCGTSKSGFEVGMKSILTVLWHHHLSPAHCR